MSKRILLGKDTFVALFAPGAGCYPRDNKDNSAISVSRRSSKHLFAKVFAVVERSGR